MKDIKFRAFHKPSKKMFDVYCFTDVEVMENSVNGVFTSETLPALRQDCELMQFTGLTDCEGKEIFEGDIIQDINDNNLTPVEFYNGSFGISVIFDGAFVPLYPYDVDVFKFKVVGNIHQNSELLEKNK